MTFQKNSAAVSQVTQNKSSNMGILELIEHEYKKQGLEQGRQEGRKEGEKEGVDKMIVGLIEQGILTIEQIASIADVDLSYVEKMKRKL